VLHGWRVWFETFGVCCLRLSWGYVTLLCSWGCGMARPIHKSNGGRVMKRLMLLVLCCCGAMTLLVASSAGAQGLPEASPSSSSNTTNVISLSKPRITTSLNKSILCEESTTGTSEETSPPRLGRFHIVFRGCVGEESGLKVKCTGLGDSTTGETLMLGEYHLVYDTGGTELGVAILFLVEPVHLTCLGIILNIVEGEQVCLIKEPYVEKSLHEMVCEGSAGVQKETWLNDNGETIKPKLKVISEEKTEGTVALELKALILFLNSKKESTPTKIVMS
jgi:hypothetical protein